MIRQFKPLLKAGSEAQVQSSVMKYIALQYPEVRQLSTASAGGLRTSKTQGKRMKATGYSKGFPDIAILWPHKGYHGLFIEMKTETGSSTPEQKAWIDRLNEKGYLAKICKGFDEAKSTIDFYLS